MGFIIYYLVPIVNPMGRILVCWKSFRNNLVMLCRPICEWLYILFTYIYVCLPYKCVPLRKSRKVYRIRICICVSLIYVSPSSQQSRKVYPFHTYMCDGLQGSFDKVQESAHHIQGSFDWIQGFFDRRQGSFDGLQGSFDKMQGSAHNI